jgi:cytochrome c biogenesis protein CcmG, thiol:disulfide interchange protein DsbE
MRAGFNHLLSTFAPIAAFIVLAFAPVSSQSKVDYKVVPILQPMKDTAPTPEFSLNTPDGKKISLKDFRGKVVLLNFWASWCVPCRTELPDLQKVSGEFAGQPVTFVGVDASDERAAAAKLLSRTGVTYPTVYDRQGIYGGIASHWSVTGLPQTWFVAKDGSRSLRVPRQITAEELRTNVKRLLDTG